VAATDELVGSAPAPDVEAPSAGSPEPVAETVAADADADADDKA
jgi:hypothetical protein